VIGITKRDVWEVYMQVKANQGAAGVDGQSIEAFGQELSDNLYRSGIGDVIGQLLPATRAPGRHTPG